MSDWNNDQGGSAHPNTFEQENWTNSGQAENTSANNAGFGNDDFDNGDGFVGEQPTGNEKCFGCGETGHRRVECPNPQEMTCRFCKQPGHMIKECPDKPPMICENCGDEGHMRKNCEKPRKINRDHVADVSADDAWNKIKQAAIERDVDDAKEAVEEYIKAVDGDITYRQLQEALIDQGIGLWLIPTERSLIQVFTNMDLQGHIDKKYTISYRFVEQADRPRELEGWPKSRDELLSRLDDAGEVVDRGVPLCLNCKELGHISKFCTQEKTERSDAVKISCFNCGADGHRVRDCPEPRVDKNACKNCGKSGHRAADCEEPPNPANVECRKCNEMGHFAKDCPQGGGSRACRNCGQEGHISKDCDQPRDMSTVTCRNCEKQGHFSRECPEPKDWSKVQCSNCQEYGHTKVRCKVPPVDEADGFGVAGDGDGDGGWSNADAVGGGDGYGNQNTGGNDGW
ncbi:Cellular nucleic acid-binding protein-like protein [Fusarium oxysporum f. sp. cubense]|uniref:Cellular nucleic acid-binding protein-like protein n=1 Tax=Fusarium oxysporum f. sp. cubense TaxID=61366 RepID=A0A559L0J1_FUSOC|nr:Cellular nucleic acid-binding protein-like protein [Fusarium oxysporum f. sp. cubense]